MQAQVAFLLLGLHTASAYTSSDANGDGTVTTDEANAVYKANYLKDYHVYPDVTGVTKGREGFYCPNVTVLQDTAKGWTGGCFGLNYNANADSEADCEKACQMDMRCAVWQWSGKDGQPNGPQGNTTHCYMGNDALGCRATRTDMKNTRAQRIRHGGYRKVADITGIQIMNLFHVTMNVSASATEAEQIARCQDNCESNTFCSVWQFLRSNDTAEAGCWLETGPNPPYIENGMKKNSTDANNMVAGQRIARTCPAPPAAGRDWTWIIIGCVAALLAALGLAAYFWKRKPAKKTSRAIKTAKAEPAEVEAPLVPMFVPQPVTYQYIVQPAPQQVVYTQQPQVVYEQPMVVTQAPQIIQQQPEIMYQAVPATAPAGSVVM